MQIKKKILEKIRAEGGIERGMSSSTHRKNDVNTARAKPPMPEPWLYQLEVNLAAIYIHTNHFYGHFIAEDVVFGVLDGHHMNKSFAA